MNTTSIARGLAVGAALSLGQAQAQPVSWPEAVDAAWQRTTAAAEAEGAARRAVADRKVADAWWAAPPFVELSHRDDRLQSDRGVRETEFGIVVPVWMPGQRGTQREAALAGLEAAESASRASRWRLAATVREAAWVVAIERAEVASAQAQSVRRWRAWPPMWTSVSAPASCPGPTRWPHVPKPWRPTVSAPARSSGSAVPSFPGSG